MDVEHRLVEVASSALAVQPDTDLWPQTSGVESTQLHGARKHIRFVRDLIQLAGLTDLSGKTVLDVGSGFGLGMVVYALLGAVEVHGIEYLEEAVDAVARYQPSLPPDLADRIHNREGDASSIPYPAGSFDVLFAVEAISHYADPQAFLTEAARVLRPGGVLLISDNNNAANPRVLRRCRETWRAFEKESGSTPAREGVYAVGQSYEEMRRALIAERYPNIDGPSVELLARNTAGWTSDAVLEAAAIFLRDGTVPDHPYQDGDVAIAPFGMAMERAFHPAQLAREIESLGFHARAYGYWGGAAGQPLVRAANRSLMRLSRVTMRFALAFRIVAIRAS